MAIYSDGLLIDTELLGFETSKKSIDQQKDYIVFGNDIDSFMRWMELDFINEAIEMKKVLP